MKTIVVYNSKTGFTQKYAQWIAEEIKCEIIPYKSFNKDVASQNDIIIFGSYVHASKIAKLPKVKEALAGSGKKLVVFATGATPLAAEKPVEDIWSANFSQQERSAIPHFYMQSGLNYENMGFAERTLMKTFAKMMNAKKDKTPEEEGFASALSASHDISSKEYIWPLVECVME